MTTRRGAPGRRGVVRSADDVPRTDIDAGRFTAMQTLIGPADGAPNFALRRFIMGEGGGMPLHANAVEHEQFVLRGRARVRIGEDVHDVRAGDTLFIPAGAPHSYEVVEAPFEFLCVVPNTPDEITLLGDAP